MRMVELGMVLKTYNSNNWETEAGGSWAGDQAG